MGLEVVFHLAPAIELVGSSEVALLHLAEDGTGINQTALAEVEVDAGTQKLFGQQGDVKVVGVVTGEVATLELLFQGLGQLLEGGLACHIGIAYARQFGHLCGNRFLGIDGIVVADFLSVGHHFDIGKLDDTLLDEIQTCGLQVENHQGLLKIQFHLTVSKKG